MAAQQKGYETCGLAVGLGFSESAGGAHRFPSADVVPWSELSIRDRIMGPASWIARSQTSAGGGSHSAATV